MPVPLHPYASDSPALLTYASLIDHGLADRAIRMQVAGGSLVRIRPGVYVSGDEWHRARPEHRVLARARALDLTSSDRPVLTHETAAALHGLPLYRPDGARVHVTLPPERPGAVVGVIRHRGEMPADDVTEIDGLLCTTLSRTVADVARTATFEQAVTVADAALRHIAGRGAREYDRDAASAFCADVRRIARRSAHGVARAERVLRFADGRSQLPGESISRIRLVELGFGDLELQVSVDAPDGGSYYVDFGIEGRRALGEFDGAIKYRDGGMLDGRTTAEAFDREKRREDWIRGTTGAPLVRWGWPDVATTATLGARLAAFGIRPARVVRSRRRTR
ncbi:type IV toxin-antitoxin system AbiEi family antitoxin domain-containing protein [Microbacterium immunditiarum]|uniref:Transcriptional regulator, AbiEi antitoxin, Type IV TA system n=1 Tax=Microbacterium immunditiarum TaxID=337480 RepID=A0A7Y9GT23_9MICO|nr:hypothetical protein [Microbacterium immunditiarum]NYE21065.1 hypothetical protein [Microbacterium immunditiarum]